MTHRPVQAPEIEHKPSAHTDYTERHPAFGQIAAYRWTGSGGYLYGSDFQHHAGVTIEVHASQLDRGLSSDHHHAGDALLRLTLSEAQWATFVSSLNAGGGVPCTLDFVEGRGWLPTLPPPESRQEQFTQEMRDTFKDGMDALKRLRAKMVERKVPKAVLDELDTCERELMQNLPFVAKQFAEHVEETTEAAKVEIGAYLSATVQRAGLAALQAGAPITLPNTDKGK